MKVFKITDIKGENKNKNKNIHHCLGCFGCFIKTPGVCVIKDDSQYNGAMMGNADVVEIVSECVYGGYSYEVKKQLDRCLPNLHADFAPINGEMHHARRYDNDLTFKICFYGEKITEEEKKLARKLALANVTNMGFANPKVEVTFLENIKKLVDGTVVEVGDENVK